MLAWIVLAVGSYGQGADPTVDWASRKVEVRIVSSPRPGASAVILLGERGTFPADLMPQVARLAEDTGAVVAIPMIPGDVGVAEYEEGGEPDLVAQVRARLQRQFGVRKVVAIGYRAGARHLMVSAAVRDIPAVSLIVVEPGVPLSPRLDLKFPSGMGGFWPERIGDDRLASFLAAPLVLMSGSRVSQEVDPASRGGDSDRTVDAHRQAVRTALRRGWTCGWRSLAIGQSDLTFGGWIARKELRHIVFTAK